MLALSNYVANQSRGEPIAPPDDERLKPFREAGRETYNRRQGQPNLACTHCHNENWGKRLAGNLIPQGHPNGYPIYRPERQSVGSLQRRLRNCLIGMRAEHYDYGAPEYVDLVYLMWRARACRWKRRRCGPRAPCRIGLAEFHVPMQPRISLCESSSVIAPPCPSGACRNHQH